jgi:hypothetical protein
VFDVRVDGDETNVPTVATGTTVPPTAALGMFYFMF